MFISPNSKVAKTLSQIEAERKETAAAKSNACKEIASLFAGINDGNAFKDAAEVIADNDGNLIIGLRYNFVSPVDPDETLHGMLPVKVTPSAKKMVAVSRDANGNVTSNRNLSAINELLADIHPGDIRNVVLVVRNTEKARANFTYDCAIEVSDGINDCRVFINGLSATIYTDDVLNARNYNSYQRKTSINKTVSSIGASDLF